MREVLSKIYDKRVLQEVIDDIKVVKDELAGILDDSKQPKNTEGSYKDVCCNPHYSAATRLGCLLAIFQQLSGVNILFMYSSTILSKIGDVVIIAILINASNVVFCLPGVIAIANIGRKKLMVVGGVPEMIPVLASVELIRF